MAPHLFLLKTEHLWRWKQMWRHLSIAVVAHETVVQRVRSNRWRFNFEMAGRGGQINFLWKTAMIITNTVTSILIICPFPRGLLLTYPLSPPPTCSLHWSVDLMCTHSARKKEKKLYHIQRDMGAITTIMIWFAPICKNCPLSWKIHPSCCCKPSQARVKAYCKKL